MKLLGISFGAARSKPLRALVFLIVIVLVCGISYLFYTQYQSTQKLLENPTDAAKDDMKRAVDKLSALVLLPDDEPTFDTVSQGNKARFQALFPAAQIGDTVLVYSKTNKAYLYRPSINKLVDIEPIGTQQLAIAPTQPSAKTTPATTVTPTPKSGKTTPTPKVTVTPTSAPITVAIYNGTKTSGLAATSGKTLKAKMPAVSIITETNAANNYTTTKVVDLSGKHKAEASQIATLFSGSVVTTQPVGEAKTTADIGVYLGPQQ